MPKYENYSSGADNLWVAAGTTWIAQTFTPSSNHGVYAVYLKICRVGSPGTITVSVRATTAGVPSGADLTSGTIDGDTLPEGVGSSDDINIATWNWITFSATISLVSGTTYAIVLNASSGGGQNVAKWVYDEAGAYTGGRVYASDDSGSTWAYYTSNNAPRDFYFEEWSPFNPTVTTQSATDVLDTSCTGNGNITVTGGENASRRGFCYAVGTSGDPTTADSVAYDDGDFGTGAYTKSITELTTETNYRVRAYAVNSGGTGYGTTVDVETDHIPAVTTQTCMSVVGTTATGRGAITDLGGANPTQHGHCWNTSANPTTANSKTTNGAASSTGAFTSAITGLTAGTAYYTRAYATNAVGTGYGDNVYFVASTDRAGYIWMEGSNLRGFDQNAVERKYIHTDDVDDTPVDAATTDPISSNWAYDHAAATDPHTGYRLESADHSHQTTGAQAGQLDHGLALTGLTDDDHTQYIKHSLATAINDFLVASGSGAFVQKTLAETLTVLGKAAASGLASLDASSLVVQNPVNATATPTASKIPIADGSGLLNGWVTLAGLGGVAKSLYDAYTILMATSDNTPVALAITEQTLVGRITSGDIAALSVAQCKTLLNWAADIATHAALLTGVHGLAITAGKTLTVQDNVTITGALGTGAYATINLYATLASPSFTGTVNIAGLTASEILITDASKNLVSAAVATYPSLTELTYVKGVTSAIQTQLGLKAPLASPTFTGAAAFGSGVLRAVAPDLSGAVTAASALTLPAYTLGGTLNANSQAITNIGALSFTANAYMAFESATNSFWDAYGGTIVAGSGARFQIAGKDKTFIPGQFRVLTPNAAGNSDVERLAILGVIATAVATWSNVTQTWSSYGAGTITADASGNLTSVSDMRLKDKVNDFELGLAQILPLQPMRFKWNKDSKMDTENTYVGFSAQEVMQYIPEAVGKQLDGYYTFNDRPIVAALVNAVKELHTEIRELRLANHLPKKFFTPILQSEERIIVSRPVEKLLEGV